MALRNITYPNLQMEMLRNKITQEDIAEALHLSRAGVNKKMTGKSEFKLSEAFLIADRFFQGLDVRYLFQREAIK